MAARSAATQALTSYGRALLATSGYPAHATAECANALDDLHGDARIDWDCRRAVERIVAGIKVTSSRWSAFDTAAACHGRDSSERGA